MNARRLSLASHDFGTATARQCIIGALLAIALTIAVVIGCRPSTQDEPTIQNRVAAPLNGVSSEASGSAVASPERNVRRIITHRHDFGLLRPGERVAHRFLVRNERTFKYTIRDISRTCNCLVARVSSESISPQHEESADVEYTAPMASANDSRALTISFAEADAPVIVLEVRATVRDEMSCFPPEVTLNGGPSSSITGTFEIHNFSDFEWSSVAAVPSADWVNVRCTKTYTASTPLQDAPPSPREVWRAMVTADLKRAGFGYHTVPVALHACNAAIDRESTASLRVQTHVSSPVAAIPGQFFFGEVEVGKRSHRSIVLRFNLEELSPRNADAILVKHNLGDTFSITRMHRRGRYWDITATLKAHDDTSQVSGEATIAFPGTSLPALVLPISATAGTEAWTASGQED
ncbi:MAG TPA: DUF1573 domain-containing protein [Pirellulales bacterium]